MPRRLFFVPLLLFAAAITLAACGGASEAPPSAPVVVPAARPTNGESESDLGPGEEEPRFSCPEASIEEHARCLEERFAAFETSLQAEAAERQAALAERPAPEESLITLKDSLRTTAGTVAHLLDDLLAVSPPSGTEAEYAAALETLAVLHDGVEAARADLGDLEEALGVLFGDLPPLLARFEGTCLGLEDAAAATDSPLDLLCQGHEGGSTAAVPGDTSRDLASLLSGYFAALESQGEETTAALTGARTPAEGLRILQDAYVSIAALQRQLLEELRSQAPPGGAAAEYAALQEAMVALSEGAEAAAAGLEGIAARLAAAVAAIEPPATRYEGACRALEAAVLAQGPRVDLRCEQDAWADLAAAGGA